MDRIHLNTFSISTPFLRFPLYSSLHSFLFYFVRVCDSSHPSEFEQASCSFGLHFLMTCNIRYLFVYLLVHCKLLKRYLLQFLPYFCIRLVFFCCCTNSLFWILTFTSYIICKYLHQFNELHFNSINRVFLIHSSVKFWYNSIYWLFIFYIFGVIFIESLLNPTSRSSSHMFSENFMRTLWCILS